MATLSSPVLFPVTSRPRARRPSGRRLLTVGLAFLLASGLVRAEDAPIIEEPEIAVPAGKDSSGAAPAIEAPPAETPPAEPPVVETAEGPGGPDDLTIEVDPGQSRNREKSLPLAMFLSAAMPGTGEYYLQEKGNAKAFLLTEAGFWASLYVAFVARESYLSSARNYASDYASIDASEKSPAFLETMATYRSYQEKQHRQDSYELAQILSGKRDRDYGIPPAEENYWDFGSSVNPGNTANWRTFQSSLRYYRASKVAINFALGALALNRLASLANTLRVYKGTSARGLGMDITPEIGPDYTGTRVTFRF
ncbi:MAG: hypothetical protein M3Y08_03185 [Fibrobacterota bacterium]|nr:hypothetical protein [Fibrobacterota bacterium]